MCLSSADSAHVMCVSPYRRLAQGKLDLCEPFWLAALLFPLPPPLPFLISPTPHSYSFVASKTVSTCVPFHFANQGGSTVGQGTNILCVCELLVNNASSDTLAFSQLSKFLQYPGEAHLAAAYRVLAYVKGTLHQGLEGKPKQVVRLGGQRFRLRHSQVDDRLLDGP